MSLANIKVVLVQTSHPGNIGAAARAMNTMGITELALVDCCAHLCGHATARAAGSDGILFQAKTFKTLDEALSDCVYVIGTSSRARKLPWPLYSPESISATIAQKSQAGKIALVFGRERDGLSNDELNRCHAHVCIPTSKNYQSLNLAQAVQLVCYEVFKRLNDDDDHLPQHVPLQPVDSQQLQGFLSHLEVTLHEIKFLNPKHSKLLMQRLRRVFMRTELDKDEINILRGILTTVQKRVQLAVEVKHPKNNKQHENESESNVANL